MPRDLKQDLLLLWLRDNAEKCKSKANEARAATNNPDGKYGQCVTLLAEAHERAAEVYASAAGALVDGAHPSTAEGCAIHDDHAVLTLTNGCQLVSHGDGEWRYGVDLHLLDPAGNEIAFWSNRDIVRGGMRTLAELFTAAVRGCAQHEAAADTERSPAPP